MEQIAAAAGSDRTGGPRDYDLAADLALAIALTVFAQLNLRFQH